MTLLEILVTIALIAMLAGFGVGGLGNILGSNKKKLAQTFLKGNMRTILMGYYSEHGFPSENAAPSDMQKLSDYFDDDSLKDPWGNKWNGKGDGNEFAVGVGQDGTPGSGENKFQGIYTFGKGRVMTEIKEDGQPVTA
jgi:type II secretory pathway pseudopilin PulG